MRTLLLKSISLIPKEKSAKFPGFLAFSLVNTLLDFISIVYLVPVVFLLLDQAKTNEWSQQYLGFNLTIQTTVALLLSLVVFYFLKNIIQSKIVKKQSLFIYGISTKISERLISGFLYDSYRNYNSLNKNAFFRDVFQLPVVFSNNVLFSFYTLFSEMAILLVIVCIGLWLNFAVTIVALLFLITIGLVLLKIQKKNVDGLNAAISGLYQDNVKNLLNLFYGFIEIKTSKSEPEFKQNFAASSRQYNQQLASLTAFKQINARYFEIIFVIGLAFAVLFVGFKNDSTAHLLFLSFIAGACIRIIPSFNKILGAYLDIKANRNVVDLLMAYKNQGGNPVAKYNFNSQLALSGVCFDFNEKPVLHHIDLQIETGDFIAFSGASGNGKTTLLQLIAGLLKPTSGEIVIDGIPTEPDDQLFDFVGYVPQQPFLFQGTILENITMFKTAEIDFGLLHSILESLALKDWIESLPYKLQTPLLLESKKLSGGQKQRIALARALYARPKLLLLDEATNQLNETLELAVLDYLHRLTQTKALTIVAVSHHHLMQQFSNKQFKVNDGKLLPNE